MFNFGIGQESAVRNVRPQLKPWDIYDVTFDGVEIREFKGVKDPDKTYKVLDIKFSNEDGYFTVTRFFPDVNEGSKDIVRSTVDTRNGGKRQLASSAEETMNIVKQTAEILNPEGFKKMQTLSAKFKSFDDVANALKTITDKVKGTKTKIKLIGRNKDNRVTATIPTITSVFEINGPTTITDNYIGNKLFFSDYEDGRRAEYLNSKPTAMPAPKADPILEVGDDLPSPTGDDEFDLNSLL